MAEAVIFMTTGTEEVEALMVVDLLRRASIDIDMVSIDDSKVMKGSHGIVVELDKCFSEVSFDEVKMIILPGGMPGTNNLMECKELTDKIKEFEKEGKQLAAICAAPSILGKNGVLKGHKATCYPGYEDTLVGAQYKKKPVVTDGNTITSRGLGTAIEFAAAIIEKLRDKETAKQILEKIIYKA